MMIITINDIFYLIGTIFLAQKIVNSFLEEIASTLETLVKIKKASAELSPKKKKGGKPSRKKTNKRPNHKQKRR